MDVTLDELVEACPQCGLPWRISSYAPLAVRDGRRGVVRWLAAAGYVMRCTRAGCDLAVTFSEVEFPPSVDRGARWG